MHIYVYPVTKQLYDITIPPDVASAVGVVIDAMSFK
jgi:hypothetical protein